MSFSPSPARLPRRFHQTGTALALMLAASLATPLRAETVLSVYSGAQSAPQSTLTLSGDRFSAGWTGKSMTAPIYGGVRVTRWSGDWGWGGEFTHAKIYADEATLARAGTDHLEFSDGLNIVTGNVLRRWPGAVVTPYAGAGLGVAVPHVEVGSGPGRTFEYQLTGPAARLFAGVSYPIGQNWEAMAEYQMTYSQNEADLTGGGTLKTNVVTHALNLGLGWRF